MATRPATSLLAMAIAGFVSGCTGSPPVNDCIITAASCRESGCKGWVDVKSNISDTGEVLNSQVIRSCPPNYLDDGVALKFISGMNHPSSIWGREAVTRLHFSSELLPSGDIFDLIEGSWGWVAPFDRRYRDFIEEGCVKNPLTLEFSDDRTTMSLTQVHPTSTTQGVLPTTGKLGTEVRYQVISHTEASIRVQELQGSGGNQAGATNASASEWELRYSRRITPGYPAIEYLYWRRGDWSSDAYDWAERCRQMPRFEDSTSSAHQ